MEPTVRRKRKLIRRAAVLAAVLMVLVPQPSASGETDRSFETSGSCTIPVMFVKIDPENLRPYVPQEFEPSVDTAGKATLQIEFFECSLKVDGSDASPNIGSTVAAFGRASNHPDEDGAYDLWQVTSRSDFHATASRLGYNAPLVKNSTFDVTRVGAVDLIAASVPWAYSPYSLEMTAGDPPPGGIEATNAHYHLGRRGLIKIDYELDNTSINAGVATVRAEPGSPFAEILGAESITTAGVLFRLDFVGMHRLIDFAD